MEQFPHYRRITGYIFQTGTGLLELVSLSVDENWVEISFFFIEGYQDYDWFIPIMISACNIT